MSNNFIQSMFGSTGGISGMLGEYNSIRSGSYGKLLKSYYNGATNTDTAAKGSTKTSNVLDRILEERRNPTVSSETGAANTQLSSSVSSLKNSLGTLQSEGTYQDEAGGKSGRDKMTSALKEYVSSYNDALESSKKSTMSNVSSNLAGVVKATKENEEALKEIGITINHDGTLALNEEKLQTADTAKVQGIFDGNSAMSYGSKAAARLNRISSYATSSQATSTDDSTASTAVASSNSKSLMESVANLKSGTWDASGEESDGGYAEVENFVKYYNATLSSARNSSVSGVTSNLASMMQKTAQHTGSLSQIGITTTADGSLKVDQTAFQASGAAQKSDVLKGYATAIESNARLLNYYSGSGSNTTSGYSASGAYSTGSSDLVSKLFDQNS